jgi:long-chain fatty acid transport protein
MPARAVVLALLLTLVLAPAAAASPLELFGFGGRSPALAATGVASADDFESLYQNPAGLAEVRGKRLAAGTLFGRFTLEGVDRRADDAAGVQVGASLPLPLGGPLAGRVGLGIGLHVPTATLNRARAPQPGVPFYAILENSSELVGVQIGAGVRLGERWSAGGGAVVSGGLIGGIDVSPDAAGRFATTSEQQLIATFAPVLGARFRPSSRWSLGAVTRFPLQTDYDIRITSNLGEALPVSIPTLRVAGTAQYDPLAIAVEVAWRPAPCWQLTAQLAYQRWSAFPLPTLNPVEGMAPQAPPGFHDTVTPRLAAEWTRRFSLGEVKLRGGYAFVMSPAPEMTGPQAFLDNHRNLATFGVGLDLAPAHIDLWTQLHLLVPRHHDRPEGVADVDTSGRVLVGGLMLGVDL